MDWLVGWSVGWLFGCLLAFMGAAREGGEGGGSPNQPLIGPYLGLIWAPFPMIGWLVGCLVMCPVFLICSLFVPSLPDRCLSFSQPVFLGPCSFCLAIR